MQSLGCFSFFGAPEHVRTSPNRPEHVERREKEKTNFDGGLFRVSFAKLKQKTKKVPNFLNNPVLFRNVLKVGAKILEFLL